jgi:hypothetical protein
MPEPGAPPFLNENQVFNPFIKQNLIFQGEGWIMKSVPYFCQANNHII